MHIGEVEKLTALSGKTIKLYEAYHLINPVKSKETGVKTYTLKDVQLIKSIKFLRSLGLSLEEIKSINEENDSLNSVLKDKINEITQKEESLKKLKKIVKKMNSHASKISELNINKYNKEIAELKTTGVDILGENREKKKKIAIILLRILMILFLLAIVILLGYIYKKEPISLPVIVILVAFPTIFIIGIIGTVKDDIKELENSEIKKVI